MAIRKVARLGHPLLREKCRDLTREEILQLPHFGDDLFRALPSIPSVSGNDVSAQFYVRGGLFRDTALRFDGIEIFEPYHLKDFQGVFSIIDPYTLGGIDLGAVALQSPVGGPQRDVIGLDAEGLQALLDLYCVVFG